MLVIGSVLQISAFFAESRELPFPFFVISFFFGGAGMVFQVSIYLIFTDGNFQSIVFTGCMCEWLHCDSFKGFWIQNEYDTRGLWYSLFQPLPLEQTVLIHNFLRCWSINRSPFLHILCSATPLGWSLSCLNILGCFQPLPSRSRF